MKLRLLGPPDIVELWAARFAALGIGGRTYPSRYNDGQLRWYGEIDDRVAATIAVVDGKGNGTSITAAAESTPHTSARARRAIRRKRLP